MERFGHRQEPIEKSGEEAITMWIAEQNIGEITPSQNPLLTKRGRLSHVDVGSVELQKSVGELLMEQHRQNENHRLENNR